MATFLCLILFFPFRPFRPLCLGLFLLLAFLPFCWPLLFVLFLFLPFRTFRTFRPGCFLLPDFFFLPFFFIFETLFFGFVSGLEFFLPVLASALRLTISLTPAIPDEAMLMSSPATSLPVLVSGMPC